MPANILPPVGTSLPPELRLAAGADLNTGKVWVAAFETFGRHGQTTGPPLLYLEDSIDGASRLPTQLAELVRQLLDAKLAQYRAERLHHLEGKGSR